MGVFGHLVGAVAFPAIGLIPVVVRRGITRVFFVAYKALTVTPASASRIILTPFRVGLAGFAVLGGLGDHDAGFCLHSFSASRAASTAALKSRCDMSPRTSSIANIVCWARRTGELPGSAPDCMMAFRRPATSVTSDSANWTLLRWRCTIRSRIKLVISEDFANSVFSFGTNPFPGSIRLRQG